MAEQKVTKQEVEAVKEELRRTTSTTGKARILKALDRRLARK